MEVADQFFSEIKEIFSEIYREHNPLETDLKFENAVRSLSA